jgi:hypothetical protein
MHTTTSLRGRILAMTVSDIQRDLDNPFWPSLTTRHAHIAQGGTLARRYPVASSPIAGLPGVGPANAAALEALVEVGDGLPRIQNQWPSRTVMPAISCQSGEARDKPAATATSRHAWRNASHPPFAVLGVLAKRYAEHGKRHRRRSMADIGPATAESVRTRSRAAAAPHEPIAMTAIKPDGLRRVRAEAERW